MIRKSMIVLAISILLGGAIGCDEAQPQGGSGGKAHGPVATNTGGVVKINGESISAAELLAAPALRQGIRQYIYFHNLRKIAKREGISADPAKIDEHIDLVKQRLVERGDTWEGYLGELFITENEYRMNIEESLLQDAIVEKRVGVTEDKMRKVWEDQKDKVIDEYISENYLNPAERDTVTFEMCKDVLFAKVMRIEGVPVLGDLNDELLDTASFEITCMTDADQRRLYEFLILESAKSEKSGEMPVGMTELEAGGESKSATDTEEEVEEGVKGAGSVDAAVGG